MRKAPLSIFSTLKIVFTFCVSALGFAVFLSSCTPGPGHGAGVKNAEPGSFSGALDQEFGEIYTKPNEANFDPCDFTKREKILQISADLERKRPAIEALMAANEAQVKTPYLKMGKYKFAAPVELQTKSRDAIWISQNSSWRAVIGMYQVIKDKPVDQDWINFNNWVRGLVFDEEVRLKDGGFVGAAQKSGPVLLSAQTAVDTCLAEPSCGSLELTRVQKNLFGSSLRFRNLIKSIENPKRSLEARRKSLAEFRERISVAVRRFTMVFNPTLRVEGNTLVIPMDLSVFGDGASIAKAWFEKNWNTDPVYNLRIELIEKSAPGYTVKVSDEVGGRAFVDQDLKVMQLYNLDQAKVMAHEFGHVIGLPDNYFSTWDKATCSYNVETNPSDIMSNIDSGQVLPEHWEKIKKLYWKK